MTCRTEELSSLSWFINETEVVVYTYDESDHLPNTLYAGGNGVLIIVIEAGRISNQHGGVFNSTSVMTATKSELEKLNVEAVKCGTSAVESQLVNLTTLHVQRMYFRVGARNL